MTTFHAAADAKTPWVVTGKGKPANKDAVVFITAEDLKATAAGKSQIMKYVTAMLADFDEMHYALCNEDGEVTLKKHVHSKETFSTPWLELLARVPGYFIMKHKEYKSKNKSEAMTLLGFLRRHHV